MKSCSFTQLLPLFLSAVLLIPGLSWAQKITLPKRQVYLLRENQPVQQVFSFEENLPKRVEAKIKTARFVRIITLWRDGTDTDTLPKIYEAYLHGDSVKTRKPDYEEVELRDGEQILPDLTVPA